MRRWQSAICTGWILGGADHDATSAAADDSRLLEEIAVLDAPSNLGLRPLRSGHVPGAWRLSSALRSHGLLHIPGLRDAGVVPAPAYAPAPAPAFRIRMERCPALGGFPISNVAFAGHRCTRRSRWTIQGVFRNADVIRSTSRTRRRRTTSGCGRRTRALRAADRFMGR